ncbi:hypothetical protein QTP88_001577 [Uroleucon formosanum]
MRNDQIPQENEESEPTFDHRNPSFMEFTPLAVLQQRLDTLEKNYRREYPYNGSILEPRIARVAPMPAEPDSASGHLSSINNQPVASIDVSTFHFSDPSPVTFYDANAAAAAPARVATDHSAVHNTPHSASYTTASSNTTTYASPPVSYTTTHPSFHCIASTSKIGYYGSGSVFNSDTDSATSTETITACEHDYNTIPPFRRRALDRYNATVATAAIRRRSLDDYKDEDMAQGAVPRKMAKRSVQHVTAVNGSRVGWNSSVGGNGGVAKNGSDEMMDCGL